MDTNKRMCEPISFKSQCMHLPSIPIKLKLQMVERSRCEETALLIVWENRNQKLRMMAKAVEQ